MGTEDDPLWGQRTVLQGTWCGLERGRGWPGVETEDCPIGDDQGDHVMTHDRCLGPRSVVDSG